MSSVGASVEGLSLNDKELSPHQNTQNNNRLSPPPPAITPTLSSVSGDESLSSGGSAKKISFGKVFGRNEQPQSLASPSPDNTEPTTPTNANMSNSGNANHSNSTTSNHNQNHRPSSAPSSTPGTPTSPNLGKSRLSSSSATGIK